MQNFRYFCSFLTKYCVFPTDLCKSYKYQVSLQSAQCEPCLYVRTDRQNMDGIYETNMLISLICNWADKRKLLLSEVCSRELGYVDIQRTVHRKYILIIKANKMHYFSTLFCQRTLHVSGRLTVHHQES
jgi:hypothetical protein